MLLQAVFPRADCKECFNVYWASASPPALCSVLVFVLVLLPYCLYPLVSASAGVRSYRPVSKDYCLVWYINLWWTGGACDLQPASQAETIIGSGGATTTNSASYLPITPCSDSSAKEQITA